MKNSLVMRTEATYSLNFLVYIQNIFLNQSKGKEEFKFPYTSTKYIFQEEFELRFKKLWDEVLKRISEHPINDMKIFKDEKGLFYQRLFVEGDENLKNYTEMYQSFKIWWDSFAGRFSVERSIDEKGQKLYVELANSLKQRGVELQKDLSISLIYDESSLSDLGGSPYFAVIPIKDFFIKYKELLSKLQQF